MIHTETLFLKLASNYEIKKCKYTESDTSRLEILKVGYVYPQVYARTLPGDTGRVESMLAYI